MAETLGALETQRDALQAQLDALEGEAPSDALLKQLEDAQKARQEQVALKAAQEKYISDLLLLDAESLQATIASLEGDIAANEAELADVRSQLEDAINRRDAAQREVDSLTAQI